MIQVNLDCEGPITQNDNAYELCEAYIPDGGDFFARISKYDDFLADVEKRPGYKAGDTLKLVLPFLKAWGVTSEMMENFSTKTLRLLPGTETMLPAITGRHHAFIISTSYRPYLDALCRATGFPAENIYCTDVNLDKYEIPEGEIATLKKLTKEIVAQPILEWDHELKGREDLAATHLKTLKSLDEIFWDIIPSMKSGEILNDVNPVGGREKAESVLKSLDRTGLEIGRVFYGGDSITDVQALELVEQGGGLALSFNGNSYSIRSANWACLSPDTMIIAALAEYFLKSGMEGFGSMPLDNQGVIKGRALLEFLEKKGIDSNLLSSFKNMDKGKMPELYDLDKTDIPSLIEKSEAFRKGVRGVALGELG